MLFRVTEDGACHGDDLGYLFNSPFSLKNLAIDAKEFELVRSMVSMVTSFMIAGKPDSDGWKPLTNAAPLKCWNISNDSRELISLPELDRVKLWDEIIADARSSKSAKK